LVFQFREGNTSLFCFPVEANFGVQEKGPKDKQAEGSDTKQEHCHERVNDKKG